MTQPGGEGAAPARGARFRLTLSQAALVSAETFVLSAIASIATTPYLVRELGVAAFGIMLATVVLAGQLGPLQLGVPSAAIRLLSDARGRGDAGAQAAYLYALAGLGLGAAALMSLGFLAIAPWAWGHGFGDGGGALLREALGAIPAATAVVATQGAVAVSLAGLVGEERFGLVSGIRAVHGVGRSVVAVVAVALGGGVAAALWAQAAADVLAALWAAAKLANGVRPRVTGGMVYRAARQLVMLGIPFALMDGLSALLVDGEKLVIGAVESAADFTYYTVTATAAVRLTVLATAFSFVLVPRLSSLAAAGKSEDAGGLATRVTRLTVAMMILMLGPLIALTPELLTLWVGPDFAERAGLSTRIVLVALFANVAVHPAHSALRALGRPMVLSALYAAELVLHVAVVYLAVRAWGLPGAALAWGLRAVLDAVAQRVLAVRALGTTLGPWSQFWGPLAALAALAAACHLLGGAAPWQLRPLAALVFGAVSALWLLSREDWRVVARTFRLHPVPGEARGQTP
ncbi:MAG TPA: lipopolysaccharide biosynthesis protein [Longimicrobium sp.]